MPSNGFLANNAMTLECWVYHDELLSSRISRYVTVASEVGVIRHNNGNAGRLHTYFKLDGSLYGIQVDDVLQVGCWHHVAGVWDGSFIRLYLDGSQVAISSDLSGKTLVLPNGNISFGSTGEYLDGRLDEVRVFNVALTLDQIRDRMHRTLDGNESGLVAYYQINETSGTTILDCVGGTDLTCGSGTAITYSTVPMASDPVRTRDNLRGVWSAHTGSLASSVMTVSNAVVSGTNFVVFGHDGMALTNGTPDKPAGAAWRLNRAWQVEQNGSTGGDVVIDTTELSDIGDGSGLRLLMDADGVFADAGGVTGSFVYPLFTVSGDVLQDGYYYTLCRDNGLLTVNITNGDFSVTSEIAGTTLGGTSAWAAGQMVWSNAANGVSGTIAASDEWQVPDVPLVYGENEIYVSVINGIGSTATDSVTVIRTTEHSGDSPFHYVSLSGANIWPYTNWTDAATSIQDAVDAASNNELVWVADGVYASGGAPASGCSLSNRVCMTKNILLQSVNGPGLTYIVGASCDGSNGPAAVRGVYMSAGTLSGFTVTNGYTLAAGDESDEFDLYGGGVFMTDGTHATNCVVCGNSAVNGGGVTCVDGLLTQCTICSNNADESGGLLCAGGTVNLCAIYGNTAGGVGGVYCVLGGVLNNCLVSGNSADELGGVCMEDSTLNSCTVCGNTSGDSVGGINAAGSDLNNCVIWDNEGVNLNASGTSIRYTCAPDGLTHGVDGCITNDPQLVDSGSGNYRLRRGSPCIDVGTNHVWMVGAFDLDGHDRILNGTVDMGAYEYLSYSEITVTGNGIEIANGDTAPDVADGTDFGSTDLGSGTVLHTFAIENVGSEELILDGTPLVEISGAHAADFTVVTDPVSPVAVYGGITTFKVLFDPGVLGVRTAIVSIASSDSDENPYTFAIRGTGGVLPEMDVQGNGQSIADGDVSPSTADDTDFGIAAVYGGSASRTFTILNSGGADLILDGVPRVGITGAHSADFTVTVNPASPVTASGGSITFTVAFDPSDGGVRSAEISIANNDGDEENPYNFAIQGTGKLLTVNATNDVDDGFTTFAHCSLREAIKIADTGDTIDFDSSLTGSVITLNGAGLIIDKDLIISGPGADQLAVSGNNASRVFYVTNGVTVNISGLTIRDGAVTGNGAGIYNEGSLTLNAVTVVTNTATVSGGGLYNAGSLTLEAANVVSNVVTVDGGGIYNAGTGTLLVQNGSHIDGNHANDDGGGIYNTSGGQVTLSGAGTTLGQEGRGNTCNDKGGGICTVSSGSTLSIQEGARVSGNVSDYDHNNVGEGGGIYNASSGTATLDNAVVDHNSGDTGGGIYSSAILSVQNHTQVNSNSARRGGGIYIYGGTPIVDASVVANNSSADQGGGGIFHRSGTLFVQNGSSVEGNTSNGSHSNGGGIYINSMSEVIVSDSAVISNTAAGGDGDGGAFFNCGDLVLTNVTVSGNSADYRGGAVYNFISSGTGVMKAYHSTIAGNTASSGGGLYIWNGTNTMANTIVANNSASSGPDYYRSSTSVNIYGDYNLVRDTTDSRYTPAAHDITGQDPQLGPLQDNGGGTLTHALLLGSPAINAIPYGANGSGTVCTNDQRGASRPGPANSGCDIGAYEYDPATADSDGDTMTDGWENLNGLNPTNAVDATLNPDNDPYVNADEYILDYNPNVSNDYFRITSVSNNSPFTVYFESSALREYTLMGCTNLTEGAWLPIIGPRAGVGGTDSMTDDGSSPANFYKVKVELP